MFYYLSGIMYDGLSELSDLSLQLQDRGLSLSTANSCIERTIRIFDSMSNTYGPKTQEVLNAGDLLKFKDIIPLAIKKLTPDSSLQALLTICVQDFSQLKQQMYQKIKMILKINLKIFLKI